MLFSVYAVIPYIGKYIERIDPEKPSLNFYPFIPHPLMRRDMYQMDDEFAALLIEALRRIVFFEGLVQYAPKREAFTELVCQKECIYSRMIDCDSLDFKEVLTYRGTGIGDITTIINLAMAYKAAETMEINAPGLEQICGVTLYGEETENSMNIRDHQTFCWVQRATQKDTIP